ncbi:MAG: HD domain-containing protein [[Eubacterium] saphenum]|nr:HD domain-containing protein [[Eubacterium] saphenum]
MEYFKLQIGCIIILLYVGFIYVKECRRYHRRLNETLFDELLIIGLISISLDGATSYTVNHLVTTPEPLNKILHIAFLLSLDLVIFTLFLYMIFITGAFPKRKLRKAALFLPFVINVAVVIGSSNSLEYIHGVKTNYSMGFPVYACYTMVAVYTLLAVFVFFKRWKHIERHKRTSIFTYLFVMMAVTTVQMFFPELLITSIAVTVFIVGVYMNLEDPAIKELSRFHNETVMSFANLVENRDNSTGGHIKRTSRYVGLIAEELQARNYYTETLTKDYITNLLKAAPLHDIGKISVPDAILKKPGKLTDEEYAIMKLHAENGGNIIRDIFRNLRDEDYRRTAFEVARYHHEKWNGKGYPDGLSGEDIPICARIMSVADVFDAVSERRCYREAMPLDKCFEIIENGSGKDFDPLIAEIFIDIRDKVEKVHAEFALETENAQQQQK